MGHNYNNTAILAVQHPLWRVRPAELAFAHDFITYFFKKNEIRPLRSEGLTPFDLPANVACLSVVSCPSDHDESRVFVGAQVEAGGDSAPRLLLDLPLQHPAGRHVENLQLGVMSSAHE